jgi:hypothetical protein
MFLCEPAEVKLVEKGRPNFLLFPVLVFTVNRAHFVRPGGKDAIDIVLKKVSEKGQYRSEKRKGIFS